MKVANLSSKMISALAVILISSNLFIYCKDANKKKTKSLNKEIVMTQSTSIPYDIKNPDKTIELINKLREISSLTFLKDNQVVCIEDESADIYIIDFQTEQIIEHIVSNKSGDYEGIELVNNNLYILKSSGTLIEFENFKQPNSKQTTYKTALTSSNNTEGLGFDAQTNSLLIACKNEPLLLSENQSVENVRCIYQFDIRTKTLIEKPFVKIDLDLLKENFGIEQFMPSGIAVHPLTGEFYILSSVGNNLIVLNRKNEIVYTEKLSKKLFIQPEGICFSPDGKKLFISNEGKGKNANILIFNSK